VGRSGEYLNPAMAPWLHYAISADKGKNAVLANQIIFKFGAVTEKSHSHNFWKQSLQDRNSMEARAETLPSPIHKKGLGTKLTSLVPYGYEPGYDYEAN